MGVVELRYSKVSGGLGQDVISLELFPTPKISLTGYYFPKLTMDPLLEDRLLKNQETQNTPYVSGNNVQWQEEKIEILPIPEGSDEAQYAARLMFYPNWGTVGFTYHKGYDVKWEITDFDVINKLKDGNGLYTDTDGDNFFYVKPRQGLSEQELYGFEVAIPVNKWTYKFELASIKTTYTLDPNAGGNNILSSAINKKNESTLPSWYNGNYTLAKEYADWVYNKNSGKLYFDYLRNIVAIGADADLDRWLLNFAIFVIHPIYFSAEEKRIAEIEEQAFPKNNDEDDWPFFPMFNIGEHKPLRGNLELISYLI